VTQNGLQKGTQNEIKNDSTLTSKCAPKCIKIASKMQSKMIKHASQNSFNNVSKPLATFEKYSNHVTTWAPKFTSLNKKCSKKSKSDSNVFNLLAAIAKHSH
jgi:thiamine kinase-like enzyme